MSLVPLTTGVIAHLLVRPFEIDRYIFVIIAASVTSFVVVFTTHYKHHSIIESLFNANVIALTFAAGFFGSTFVHRAFFHRLHRFPGPFLAKVSRFYAFNIAITTLQTHLYTLKAHEKYGDFVRVGMCIMFARETWPRC